MAYTQLNSHFTPSARVEEISRDSAHYRLTIPAGKADAYRVAQLYDYAWLARRRFPHRYPLTLGLSARTSSDSLPGTWGFGLWNDPFGLALGFGGKPFRLPALPNAVVVFWGIRGELSFIPHFVSRFARLSVRSARNAANGFFAQSFRSPRFHPC
jgi:hypothetical protein